MSQIFEAELLKRASLFTLTLRAWGNRRQGDMTKVDTEADKRRLSLTKTLIASPEYDAIRAHLSNVRQWTLARCMPSFLKEGIYLVSLEVVTDFDTYLKDAIRRLDAELVPALVAAYPGQVADSRDVLGDQFRANDYPAAAALPARFGIGWGWINFTVPDNLPAEIREEETAKLRKQFEDAQGEIIAALRSGFADLVKHAVDRLTVPIDGKAPVFRNTLIDNFRTFFDTFRARNLMNDAELAEQVERARRILADVSPDVLRDNKTVRSAVADSMAEVKAVVDKLVQAAPSRAFDVTE